MAMPTEADDSGDLAFQLVDGDCKFNIWALNDFERKVNLKQCGRSYAVVAIMGPQSSGKSTLLNHLFSTEFRVMEESAGRCQTTKGIWLARCPDIDPLTLVMDIEGTDGTERGEDHAFENRSSLFALAIADVVLINMWCKDIGLNNAANRPLLKIVFQQVIVRFTDKPRKTTLLFVIRDKSRTPERLLRAKLKDDIQQIWSSTEKPKGRNDIQLTDFFKVEVKFLPHYEYRYDEFIDEVENLKKVFINSTAPDGIVGDQKEPVFEFSRSAQFLWDEIMENRNLDLPSVPVMVANMRCDVIKEGKYESFKKNEVWDKLYKRKDNFFNQDFGEIVNSILKTYVSQYDAETEIYHEATRNGKRKELIEKLLNTVKPVYQHNIEFLRLEYLTKFEGELERSSTEHNTLENSANQMKHFVSEFEEKCEAVKIHLANWDTSEESSKLEFAMKSCISAKGDAKVDSIIRRSYEPRLRLELSDRVRIILCEETDPDWHKVREHYKSVIESTISRLNDTMSKFCIDEEGRKKRVTSVRDYGKDIVEKKAREESGRANEHMIAKFLQIFKADREWRSIKEIAIVAKEAKYKPMDVLTGLAAIRLQDGVTDNIGEILSSALLGPGDPTLFSLLSTFPWLEETKAFGHLMAFVANGVVPNVMQLILLKYELETIRARVGHNVGHAIRSAVLGSGKPKALKLLDSSTWPEVPPERTLIQANQCKKLWDKYVIDFEDAINKVIKDIEEKRISLDCCHCPDSCCDCCTIT